MDIVDLKEIREMQLKSIFYSNELLSMIKVSKIEDINVDEYIVKCIIKQLKKDMKKYKLEEIPLLPLD